MGLSEKIRPTQNSPHFPTPRRVRHESLRGSTMPSSQAPWCPVLQRTAPITHPPSPTHLPSELTRHVLYLHKRSSLRQPLRTQGTYQSAFAGASTLYQLLPPGEIKGWAVHFLLSTGCTTNLQVKQVFDQHPQGVRQGSPNFTARGPHELSASKLRADKPYTAGQRANILIKRST